jgi:hypothetical protein
MSIVNISNCALKRVAGNITGTVTFEVTFNESEVKLDIPFSGALYVVASFGCTDKVTALEEGFGRPSIPLSAMRIEATVPLTTVRPAGLAKVVTTVPVDLAVVNMFRSGHDSKFSIKDAAVDVRVELNPIPVAGSASLADQRFV